MTKTAEAVLHDAMALPVAERAELTVELLASLDGEPEDAAAVEAAWAAEIDRRVDRVPRGEAKGRPWEDVRADLEQRNR
jgi:putative addiction module component (TIGR02574 family)